MPHIIRRYRDGRPRRTAEYLLFYRHTGDGIAEDWTPWRDHALRLAPDKARPIHAELCARADEERAAGIEHPFSYVDEVIHEQ